MMSPPTSRAAVTSADNTTPIATFAPVERPPEGLSEGHDDDVVFALEGMVEAALEDILEATLMGLVEAVLRGAVKYEVGV